MSRSDWLFFIAVGGFLTFGLVFTGLQNTKHAHCVNCGGEAGGIVLHDPQKSFPLDVAATQAPPHNPHPDRAEWRDERDLQAQLDMAEWAMWMAIISAVSILITGIGIIYVARTLRTSQETVRLMGVTAERQLRAYVAVSTATIEGASLGVVPQATITLRNAGQTPAYNLGQWSMMGVAAYPLKVAPPKSDSQPIISRQTLGPGETLIAVPVFSRELDLTALIAIGAGKAAFYVTGEITYEDAFGHPRITRYFLFAGKNVVNDGSGPMAAYLEGNHST